MSRIAKWKLEKTKVKVVFRLQFNATHIPQFGWDKLFISFIPADSGKATAKTTKASVRNGSCKWGDPIYETSRLLQDTRTKKFDDKLYKFVVAMGSTRSSILGEASINLSDYADALKPSSVALPLNGCESGTVLHVTVQLLTSKTGFREFEQQRELRERGLQTFSDQNSHGESHSRNVSTPDDSMNDHSNKVNARIGSKGESNVRPLLGEEVGHKEEYADSATGFDGSSNTSGSIYAEKHDMHEIDSIKSTVSGDLGGLSIAQSPESEKGDTGDQQYPVPGSNSWAHNWGTDYSANADLVTAYKENNRLRESLEVAELSIIDLKLEVSSLQNHADEIGAETQKIAWQLATEIASGKELAEEVSVLKSERLNLKEELEQLKNLQINVSESCKEMIENDQNNLCQKLELHWLKGHLTIEENIRDLLNKAHFGCQDRDVRFILPDLEALLCFVQDFKERTGQAISCFKANHKEIGKSNSQTSQMLVSGTGFDSDVYHTDSMLHCLIPGLVSYEPNSVDAISSMKAKIFELLRELDESKGKQESLVRKMDQMECYYEAFIQELEENQRQMIGELQNLRNEHAACVYTITAAKDEMEALQHEMNDHLTKFSEDKKNLDSINKELERRAHSAEAALKRARLNYSISVNQLQKDLNLLSVQVTSMYETNENLIKHALADSLLPNSQGYSEIGLNPKVELEEYSSSTLLQGRNHPAGVKKYNLSGGIFSEDLKRSLYLQEGLYQKVEDEVLEVHLVNIYLDVFSKTLQETLIEAKTGFELMNERMIEFSRLLELSTKSKDLLFLELQTSLDEIQSLNDYKANIAVKCNEMASKTEILEENLLNVTHENSLLTKKITEWEALVIEYRSFEEKYQTCHLEKLELENLMMEESTENRSLRDEISSMHKELQSLRVELDNLFAVKEDMHNTVNFVHGKLSNLWALNNPLLLSESVNEDLESNSLAGLVLQFEDLHLNACKKIHQLMDENEHLVEERDMDRESLSKIVSDNLIMKEKFEHEREGMVNRLDEAYAVVQKFQMAIENVSDRVDSCGTEDKYIQQHKEFVPVLDHMEDELQQLTSKNDGLAKEIMALKMVSEELGNCKLTTEVLTVEKRDLLESLKKKTVESTGLLLELQHSKEHSQSLSDELLSERSVRAKLENRIKDLDSQIIEKSCKLLEFDKMMASLQKTTEESTGLVSELQHSKENSQSLSDELLSERSVRAKLENRIKELDSQINEKSCELLEFDKMKASLQKKTEESTGLVLELQRSKENSQSLSNELLDERSVRATLENRIKDLDSQINEKSCELLEFDKMKAEVRRLKQSVLDLESEKSRVYNLLLQSEELLKHFHLETSSSTCLETQLCEMHEFSIAADIRLIFTRIQYEDQLEKIVQQFLSSDRNLNALQDKYLNVETALNHCLVSEAHQVEENATLLMNLNSLKTQIEALAAENKMLLDTNKSLMTHSDKFKNRNEILELAFDADRSHHAQEVEKLGKMLMACEGDIDSLLLSKEELEVNLLVVQSKMDEQHARVVLLEGMSDEMIMLKNRCHELNQRLSEQILKTEEFKNLSIHLKDLKDKADAECFQIREKKENEGQSNGMQESLRMAFIKEQCETKLQELKLQLSGSKKHSEEMLLKLQDAIDEVETRKKSEVSHIKRNEELGKKISELESNLNVALSEKREIMKAYDLMKAEKECASISLECCREEKQELEASLQKCNDDKLKFSMELNLMKDLLESHKFYTTMHKEGSDEKYTEDHMPDMLNPKTLDLKHQFSLSNNERIGEVIVPQIGQMHDPTSKFSGKDNAVPCEEVEHGRSGSVDGTNNSHTLINGQGKTEQDVLTSRSVEGRQDLSPVNQDVMLYGDTKHLALVNHHFRDESLKSSMDYLNEELERMKNENSLLQNDPPSNSDFPGLERELMQLHKVNEELGSIFPLFKKISGNGNALERVLALEIELAESLQAKKKSSMHFQSSFLKQHSDEEAIFRSFRDINELIKDMLDLKGRYTTVETELREMHDRYSQLSLQFAEVEGERQKLMMTVKNVRASKKLLSANRSSWSSNREHSPP